MSVEKINYHFNRIFKKNSQKTAFAPGRVNLIGEHTDYSEGFVMPIAINKGIYLGIAENEYNNKIRAFSIDFDQKKEYR